MLKNIPLPRSLSAETVRLFWAKVDKGDGPNACWRWTASVDSHGYGKMKIGGTTFRAHRLAYMLMKGQDPQEMMVCHTCDVPQCCNAAHHFLGDNQANQRDAVRKGRQKPPYGKGEDGGNAKLSQAQVDKIKEMIRSGSTNKAIARVFGVTHQMISRIRRGRAWGSEPMQPKYASIRATKA